MATPTHLSFLSYAVNGGGLGHVVRQAAVQRWVRRYCAFAGVRSEHWFLTTSEADTLLFHDGFASFKMPSKTVVDEAGVNKAQYIALAKQWVWTTLTTLRPDVLLVDTFPNGSFHELAAALDIVDKRVLVLRPVKEDFARRGGFSALCALYDKVIVSGDEDEADRMAALLGLAPGKLAVTGPIVGVERLDLVPRPAARRALGAGDDSVPIVLVSGGGGGDPDVERLFDSVERALAGRDVHVVYAAGPLFRGTPRRGPRRTWIAEPGLARLFGGVDVAVCAAGFNTLHELMLCGVPSLFVPQDKIADDQRARAERLAAIGAARVASLADEGALTSALRGLLDDAPARAQVGASAAEAVPESCARDAALEVLALALPRSLLRQARAAISDEVLAGAAASGVALAHLVDVAAALAPDGDRASLELDGALALLRAHRAPPEVCARVAAQLRKKAPGGDGRSGAHADDLAGAVTTLLSHRGLEGQWSALQALLAALGSERVLGPQKLVDELLGFVDAATSAGLDAFSAARLLQDASGGAGAPGDDEGRRSNRAVLQSARARLRSVA